MTAEGVESLNIVGESEIDIRRGLERLLGILASFGFTVFSGWLSDRSRSLSVVGRRVRGCASDDNDTEGALAGLTCPPPKAREDARVAKVR